MLTKTLNRSKIHKRIRSKISWTSIRPRLAVFRSNSNIYAQLIDDTSWKTLAHASDLKLKKSWTKTEMSTKVWEDMASKINSLKITHIVFDRGWFSYHGRVKALAEALRSKWVQF
jgi:large subunit ribosomal protein L18